MAALGAPFIGRRVGDFVLGEKLGQGAFGAVYAAEQRGLGREAAVKVLRPSVAIVSDGTARFLREAKLAARLDHPYAAHVYAFGAEPDGLLWIAMERVRGTTLADLIKTSGPLALDRFAPLFERICEVVQSAHDQGIVHRDLKPANVMVVSRAGRLLPKLLDFGIARPVELGFALGEGTLPLAASGESSLAFDRTGNALLTQQGQVLGSPAYMAPEQWHSVERVGPWSDQYALAVLAYEVLVGAPPFRATSLEELAHHHLTRPWPALPAPLPAATSTVLARAAAKRPEDRFAKVGDFAAALRDSAGFSSESLDGLPALPAALRDAWISDGPPPIAEAIALLARARSAAQAEDAIATTVGLVARWLGLVALAGQSKHAHPIGEDRLGLVRELRQRALRDDEWLALAQVLASPQPMAGLTRFLASPMAATLDRLLNRRVAAVAPEADARLELDKPMADLASVLEALGWLCDFPLAHHVDGRFELWMGCVQDDRVHVPRRSTTPLSDGAMVLLDPNGDEVLLLSPIVRVARLPGSERDALFLLVGPSRSGGALAVAMPRGLERDDDAIWPWLRAGVLDHDGPSGVDDDDRSPWRGLAPLRAEDEAFYVGRERQVAEVVDVIGVQPLVVIVGPSGVGKTSFLQAGVLPALPEHWRTFAMRPGRSPLRALGAVLAGASGGPYREDWQIETSDLASRPEALGERLRTEAIRRGATCVLVVDAFEELFTLGCDETERDAFVAALAAAASSTEEPVRIIFAMRDDFLCRAEALEPLRGRLGRGMQLLATPTSADLERIVTVPATRSGYTYDDEALPAEMVAAVRDRPGALPLLSFTASRLFELRDRHFKRLSRASYDELGGVTGALVRHADGALDRMPAADRVIVRRAFSRLVTPDGTRASLGRAELGAALGDKGSDIIDRLLAARLLVSSDHDDGERIEVIHETLLTAWPRLVTWRREDADGARFRAQLAAATRQWDDRGRRRDLLWRGETAAELRRRGLRDEPLTPTERAFVTASLAADQRGRRRLIAGLAMLSIVLASGSALLLRANRHISDERARAVDQLALNLEDHARHASLDNDPALALLYLAEAAKLGATGAGHDVLVARALRPLVADSGGATALGEAHAVAQSRDGRLTAVASEDHLARVFDTATGQIVSTLVGDHAPVLAVAMTSDGSVVATSSAAGEVGVWNHGELVWRHVVIGGPRMSAIDLDEQADLVITGSWDGIVRLFSLATGAPRGEIKIGDKANGVRLDSTGRRLAVTTPVGGLSIYSVEGLVRLGTANVGEGFVLAVRFSPDDTTVATASQDHRIRLWDAATARPGRILAGHAQAVQAIEFSSDGQRLASTSRDGTARIWNIATAESVVTSQMSGAALVSVHFSRDGKQIVTAGADHTARVWDSTTGLPIASVAGHSGRLVNAVFDPTGTGVLTAGSDGAVRRWDIARATTAIRLAPGAGIVDARYSPDGNRVATAGSDGNVVVWEGDGRRVATIEGKHAAITSIAFASTSARLATGDEAGNLQICDSSTGRCEISVKQQNGIESVRFSADGRAVVTAGADGYVRVWGATSGARDAEVKVDDEVFDVAISARGDRVVAIGADATILAWPSLARIAVIEKPTALISGVAISPDGSTIAIAGKDHIVKLFTSAGTPGAVIDTQGGIANMISFSPDGQHLVVANEDATAQIWEIPSGRRVNTLAGHGGPVLGVNWSPDGRLVVTAGSDATARVWDAATARLVLVLAGHTNMVRESMFSPDGNHVVTTSDDGSAILWDTARDHRDADALDALVRCLVPYQLVDGVVLPATPDPHACR